MTTTPPATTTNPHQPGKSWVVLNDGDGTINITLPLGFGMMALLVFTAMGCGMQNLCRRRNSEDEETASVGYSVAVTNSLFRDESISKDMPPCMNCVLIEMGEMACYQERCPECGRIPPGRKKAKPPDLFKKLVGRKLSTKKPSKSTAMMVMEAGTNTSQLAFPESVPQLQNGQGYARQSSEQYFAKNDKRYTANGGPGLRQLQEDSMV